MKSDQGYQFEHCRKNCVKSMKDWTMLHEKIEETLQKLNLRTTMSKRFNEVSYHHIPKISLAGCPNGCSRPHIKDIGIVGYVTPQLTDSHCNGCRECSKSCLEGAITWDNERIILDSESCLSCGDCIRVCSTGKISQGESGWMIYEGGRLGRHPQLAKVTGKETTEDGVVANVHKTLVEYFEKGLPEERLSRFLERRGFES